MRVWGNADPICIKDVGPGASELTCAQARGPASRMMLSPGLGDCGSHSLVLVYSSRSVACVASVPRYRAGRAIPNLRARPRKLDGNENRWNDKPLSFIVCENGASAYWCEHSMIDGASLDHLRLTIDEAINDSWDFSSPSEQYSATEGQDYTYYPFQSSPTIDARAIHVRQQHNETIT